MGIVDTIHRTVNRAAAFQPRVPELRIAEPTVAKMGMRDACVVERGLLHAAVIELCIMDSGALETSARNATNRELAICKP